METTGLRRGNKVLFSEDGTEFEVINIDDIGIAVRSAEEDTWIEISAFEGINITEGLLITYGFKRSDIGFETYFFHNKIVEINLKLLGNYFWFRFRNQSIITVESLHNLQNLVFFTTGQELELCK